MQLHTLLLKEYTCVEWIPEGSAPAPVPVAFLGPATLPVMSHVGSCNPPLLHSPMRFSSTIPPLQMLFQSNQGDSLKEDAELQKLLSQVLFPAHPHGSDPCSLG